MEELSKSAPRKGGPSLPSLRSSPVVVDPILLVGRFGPGQPSFSACGEFALELSLSNTTLRLRGKKTSGLQGGWAYFALKLCGYPSKLSLELAGVVRYKLRSDMGSGLGGRKAGTPYQALYHQ